MAQKTHNRVFVIVAPYPVAARYLQRKFNTPYPADIYLSVNVIPRSKIGRFLYHIFYYNVFNFQCYGKHSGLESSPCLASGRIYGLLF